MEPANFTVIQNAEDGEEALKHQVDQVLLQIDSLEQKVIDIEQFYIKNNKKQSSSSEDSSGVKDKDGSRDAANTNNQQQDVAHMNTDASKRMQELIRQFDTVLHQTTQNMRISPFMEPVDVEGLGLDDYYQVIEKPMDLGTIRKKMETNDGSGYKHVRDFYADVRLVFRNAMKYNDKKNDIHVMASYFLNKLEGKWLQILPKVIEEEKRREMEEAEILLKELQAKEAVRAKMALDVSDELYEVYMHLEELRETVLQKCGKMTIDEKRALGTALTHLSTEDISKALQIVAQSDPAFETAVEEVDLDIDALSETTLWRLMFFVKDALRAQYGPEGSTDGDSENKNNEENKNNANGVNNSLKQKREMCDGLARTEKKKSRTSS